MACSDPAQVAALHCDFSFCVLLCLQRSCSGCCSSPRQSGFGRIKHKDGRYEDITPHGRGIVRTLLDDVVPNLDNEPDLYIS